MKVKVIKKGTLKEVIAEIKRLEVDADVYGDYIDNLLPAICGEIELTHEGYRHFQEVLNYPSELMALEYERYTAYEILVATKDAYQAGQLHAFCLAQAGYVGESRYNAWFV